MGGLYPQEQVGSLNGRSQLKREVSMHNTEINQMNWSERVQRGGWSSRLHDSRGLMSRLLASSLSVGLFRYGLICGEFVCFLCGHGVSSHSLKTRGSGNS